MVKRCLAIARHDIVGVDASLSLGMTEKGCRPEPLFCHPEPLFCHSEPPFFVIPRRKPRNLHLMTKEGMPRYRSARHCGRGCLAIARHDRKGLSPRALFLSSPSPHFLSPPSPPFLSPRGVSRGVSPFLFLFIKIVFYESVLHLHPHQPA